MNDRDAHESAGRVLVVEDESVARKMLTRILTRDGYEVSEASGGEQAVRTLGMQRFDVVLTDLVMQGVDGLRVLREARRLDDGVEVILMTGHATVDTAIEAMKGGAFHYLQKPLRPDEVRSLVRQACEKKRLRARLQAFEQEGGRGGLQRIVGTSAAMKAIREQIEQIRASDSNVLITGESGTGKELVARAIHATSRRSKGKFVAFNCASFADELLANELFGHEREAFTGASSVRAGLLESGDGGTVFLDEVGDMTPAMQAKMLRVVQEREILRVGGTRPLPVDIRIISATNKDLPRLIGLKLFREDLFFRLNVIPLRMPPLSERREDIPLLAMHFLRRLEPTVGKHLEGFTDAALGMLIDYHYPGNVRELENIVERAATLAVGERIDVANLPPDMTAMEVRAFRFDTEPIRTLEQVERDYIQWVLNRVGHNKTQAARLLGIDRVSLYRKLRKEQLLD
ncbi:MAG TPA: sigma-54 dependent transcriptional regulator [Polyangiaceae bacterium]|jgi:DNA-binding NtrC family response regulator|nr:MAG: Transcriptional regulatory protein ZraR [Deltaproteobacteria bacterium ADurb.Bin207]HNZ22754.1 sigma-54 dependent transcriptional regulator [Polyangiaceae bacterium]HOD25178.1 sigma-54 dependent transcriptional regulator [Polyangiaceae bacterium]HOE47652.1 sigma-54 dependent transcriptional regulator [Polyangiaceae bacterium]HOH01167.1 sigma-54 dependent transcriptional regulator [Polyangiaceae bacterium]